MLLQELYDKPTKPWRQVSKEQKAALYAKIYKGKKNVAAAEVASQLNKMGYIVSARTVDKDQEKPEFKAHDYNRPVGTKIETRAKVANKAKNESVNEGWKKEDPNSNEKTNRDKQGQKVEVKGKGPGVIQYQRRLPTTSKSVPYGEIETIIKLDKGGSITCKAHEFKVVKSTAKNESVDSIVLAARALKEAKTPKCDKLKAEIEELEAHKKSLMGDASSTKGRAELTAKISKLKAELKAEKSKY